MKHQKIRIIGVIVLLALWAVLTAFAWLKPAGDISEAERRPLEQFPTFSVESVFDGKFATDFESYTLDQFPFRDTFRKIKAWFLYYGLRQKDNNGIYLQGDVAAKLEYPLNEAAVNNALNRFNHVYENYLKDSGSTVQTQRPQALVPIQQARESENQHQDQQTDNPAAPERDLRGNFRVHKSTSL